MDPKVAKAIDAATTRANRIAGLDWGDLMFGPQREFIEDKSRLKVACCSRRAGKSHSVALALLKAGFQHAGSYPVYMNMNRASAKVIIWPALREIDRKLNLGLKFNNVTSNIHLPNESVIQVYGVGSRREMDKTRGGKPPAVCLDEAQNMGQDMLYLINEILLPSTADYQAPIMITGTPSNNRHSPFYKIATGGQLAEGVSSNWSVHHWTMKENPYIPDYEGEIELALAANPGWTRNTPGFRREYLGEWLFDTHRTAFDYREHMVVPRFPIEDANDWRYIIGVDLGTEDPCAFAVLAYSRSVARCYVLEAYRKGDLSVLEAGTEVERLMNRYPNYSNIVVDSGGQGAAFVRQWKDTHPHIPARPVKKGYDSVDMGISIMNADIRAGKLYFVEPYCLDVLAEMSELQWDEKSLVLGKRVIKRGLEDHASDAVRYAYTKVKIHDIGGFVVDDTPKDREEEFKRHHAQLKKAELSGDRKKTEPLWVRAGRWKRPGRRSY